MNLRRTLLFLIFLWSAFPATADDNVYHQLSGNQALKVLPLDDGGYAAVFRMRDTLRIGDKLFTLPKQMSKKEGSPNAQMLVAFDARHQIRWTRRFASARSVTINDLQKDQKGRIVLVGQSSNCLWYENKELYTDNKNVWAGFVARFQANGENDFLKIHRDKESKGSLMWVRVIPKKDAIYLAGTVNGKALIKGHKLWSDQGLQGSITGRVSNDGRLLGLKRVHNDMGHSGVAGYAYLPNGEFLLAINTNNPVKLNNGQALKFYTSHRHTGFLIWLNPNGQVIRYRRIANSGALQVTHLKAAKSGQVYVLGTYNQNIEVEQERLPALGSTNLLVACFDHHRGKFRWKYTVSDRLHYYGLGLEATSDNKVHVAFQASRGHRTIGDVMVDLKHGRYSTVILSLDQEKGNMVGLNVFGGEQFTCLDANKTHLYASAGFLGPVPFAPGYDHSQGGFSFRKIAFTDLQRIQNNKLYTYQQLMEMYPKATHATQPQPHETKSWTQSSTIRVEPQTQYLVGWSELIRVGEQRHGFSSGHNGLAYLHYATDGSPATIEWLEKRTDYPELEVETSNGKKQNRWAKFLNGDAIADREGNLHLVYVVRFVHNYLDKKLPTYLRYARRDAQTGKWTITTLAEEKYSVENEIYYCPVIRMDQDQKPHVYYHQKGLELFDIDLSGAKPKTTRIVIGKKLGGSFDVLYKKNGRREIAFVAERALHLHTSSVDTVFIGTERIRNNVKHIVLHDYNGATMLVCSEEYTPYNQNQLMIGKQVAGEWNWKAPLQHRIKSKANIVADKKGGLHIAVANQSGVMQYIWSDDGGDQWEAEYTPFVVTNPSNDFSFGILADATGIDMILPKQQSVTHIRRDNPNQPDGPVSTGQFTNDDWREAVNNAFRLQLTDDEQRMEDAAAIARTRRNVHVLMKYRGQLMLASTNLEGKEWNVETLADTISSYPLKRRSINNDMAMVADQSGVLHIAYSITKTIDPNLSVVSMIYVQSVNGLWKSDTLQTDTLANSTLTQSNFAVNIATKDRRVHIAFAMNGWMHYATRQGRMPWHREQVFTVKVNQPVQVDIEVGTDHLPRIAYFSGAANSGTLYYAERDAGLSTWWTEPVQSRRGYPDLIIDQNNVSHLFIANSSAYYVYHGTRINSRQWLWGNLFEPSGINVGRVLKNFRPTVKQDDQGRFIVLYPSTLDDQMLAMAISSNHGKSWDWYMADHLFPKDNKVLRPMVALGNDRMDMLIVNKRGEFEYRLVKLPGLMP